MAKFNLRETAAQAKEAAIEAQHRRRRRRRQIVGLGLFVIVWTGALGAWIAQGGSIKWERVMSDFSFSGDGTVGMRKGIGQRAQDGTSLSYLGNGKVTLGEFSVKIFDPITKTTMRTDFRLEGETTFPEEGDFHDFMRDNNRQFREQVMVTLRNVGMHDLEDADLTLLERKLVSRVNRHLSSPFLTSVDIKNFLLYESVDNSAFTESQAPYAVAP